MHKDAVLELLTNKLLIEYFLSEEVLEEMSKQTFEDIKNVLIGSSVQGPEYFLAYLNGTNQAFIKKENEKKIKLGAKQGVKLPWSCQDNIKAVIEYLNKLHFRAGIEKLPKMTIILQDRVKHFSQKLIPSLCAPYK